MLSPSPVPPRSRRVVKNGVTALRSTSSVMPQPHRARAARRTRRLELRPVEVAPGHSEPLALERDHAAPLAGVARVHQQVHHRRRQLAAIDADREGSSGRLDRQRHGLAEAALEQPAVLRTERLQADDRRAHRLLAREGQQPLRDAPGQRGAEQQHPEQRQRARHSTACRIASYAGLGAAFPCGPGRATPREGRKLIAPAFPVA